MIYHVQLAMIMEVEATTLENAEQYVDNVIDGNVLAQNGIKVTTRNVLASEYERNPVYIPAEKE